MAQRDRRLSENYAAEPAPQRDGAAQMEILADRGPLGQAIQQLSPDQRATIALFYGQELSVTEIAAALSVPAGTVKTRLMHARRKLRNVLEDGGSDG